MAGSDGEHSHTQEIHRQVGVGGQDLRSYQKRILPDASGAGRKKTLA